MGRRGRQRGLRKCVRPPASLPRLSAPENQLLDPYINLMAEARASRARGLPLRSRIFFPLVRHPVVLPLSHLPVSSPSVHSRCDARVCTLFGECTEQRHIQRDRFSLARGCVPRVRERPRDVARNVDFSTRDLNSNPLSFSFSPQGADEDDSASVASVSSSPTADRDYCARQSDEEERERATIHTRARIIPSPLARTCTSRWLLINARQIVAGDLN